MFTYDKMPNGLYMTKEFPELELGSEDWWRAMPVSILACVIYCVTFIAYCAHAALTAPQQAAENPIFVKQYMFMIGMMRPECWWWLLVSVTYGLSVNLIQTLSSSVHFKLYGCIFAGMVFVALEIYVLPFKFMLCNIVDLILKSGVFLIWMYCLPLIEHHESADLSSLHNVCGFLIITILILINAVAGGAFLYWAIGLLKPPGVERGETLQRAMQSRHIFAKVELLPEKELLSRLSKLGDGDLNKLSRCTSMVASALLGLQPSDSLFRQRVMPGVKFVVWDPKKTEQEIMDSTLNGDHERSLLLNLKIKKQLETLSRLMEEQVFKRATEGKPFFETGEVECSMQDGTLKYLTSYTDYVERLLFNLVLTYNSTDNNKKGALLGLHNKKLDLAEFRYVVKDLLGGKAENLNLDKIFKLLDLDNDGAISMGEFVACIMSEAQGQKDRSGRFERSKCRKIEDVDETHDAKMKTLLNRRLFGLSMVKEVSGHSTSFEVDHQDSIDMQSEVSSMPSEEIQESNRMSSSIAGLRSAGESNSKERLC
jgi:hypothetical protein